ncbi:Hsp20/alpha crystallin family protein [Acidobacteria bacterium AH-259-A15]|nr:Hsp20/alpha crystallin family protein [Acidobacteria bacterium AH-259-A15]
MKKTEKEKYEKHIRELEERIKELEARSEKAAAEESEQAAEEGAAAGILETLGKSFGLSGLIKSVSKMPEFQDRLEEIDEELRTRLKEAPLKESTGRGRRGVPSRVGTRRRGPRPVRSREEPPPEPSRQVDIFDEDNHLLVVCEIPGSKEDKIDVKLNKDKLSITAETFQRKGGTFQKQLILPCIPEGELSQSYKNGILRIRIMKEKNE